MATTPRNTMVAVAWLTVALFITMPAHATSAQDLATGAMANFTVLAERKPVPRNSFVDADGNTLTLADFKGKVVLLNLWATWCAPCRREMPDLDALQRDLGGERFQVVALSSDRGGIDVVGPFFEEIGVSHLDKYNDKTMKLQRELRAFGLPTTLLIDAQGREIGRLVGPAEWGSEDALRLIRHFIETETKPSH